MFSFGAITIALRGLAHVEKFVIFAKKIFKLLYRDDFESRWRNSL